MDELKNTCAICGATHENLTEVKTKDGFILVCDDCLTDNAFYCEHCNTWFLADDFESFSATRRYENIVICEYCLNNGFVTCESCGDILYHNEACECHGEYYCENCFDEHFTTCEDCGCTVPIEDAVYHNGSYYCEDCAEDIVSDDRIYGYHDYACDWKKLRAPGDDENCKLFGIELEVEAHSRRNESKALDVLDENLKAYYSEDGSLNDCGFEIVTHPMSYQYILEHKDNIKTALEKLSEFGYYSHNGGNCGLHIHVTAPKDNRPEVINRLWLILEYFKDEVIKLSRRQDLHYCEFLSDAAFDGRELKRKGTYYLIDKTSKDFTRYLVLNTTKTEYAGTIELRVFRGTLKYETFMAALEFTNNLYSIAYDLNRKIEGLTWSDLTQGDFIKAYCENNNISSNKVIANDGLDWIKKENNFTKQLKCFLTLFKKAISISLEKELATLEKKTKNSCALEKMAEYRKISYKYVDLISVINNLQEHANFDDFGDFDYYMRNSYEIQKAFEHMKTGTKDSLQNRYTRLKNKYKSIKGGN